MTKDENKAKQIVLLTEKQTLENRLDDINVELTILYQDICLWNFDTHEDAKISIIEVLEEVASDACEGSYKCGKKEYNQNYTLFDSPTAYTGTIKVQYNRHDKTCYYIEDVQYSFKEAIAQ